MISDKPSLDTALLEHHGVKGMRWGTRKAKATSSKPTKLSRKEVRVEKKAFYEKKADSLIKEALKHPNVLIKLNTGTEQHVITGKEFVTHMSNRGAMNVKWTDVYARQAKDGIYEKADPVRYVRSDKKK